jgi:hypothetical protein
MTKPKMNRRTFLGAALGAVAVVSVVRFASAPADAAPGGVPGPPPGRGPRDMIMPDANGGYMTHLLPFAAPFPTEAAAQAEVAHARKQGLFK